MQLRAAATLLCAVRCSAFVAVHSPCRNFACTAAAAAAREVAADLRGGFKAAAAETPHAPTDNAVQTQPIAGMRPGTSGLRKKVKVWQGEHYLENFVQCILDAQGSEALHGCTIVLGGDGRFYNSAAVQTIIRMAAANGVGRVWVGQNGLLSTPAVSAVIRERQGGNGARALLGIVLTASHNQGGPEGDFGIKFNNAAGSPAPETVTERVYAQTQSIKSYRTLHSSPDVDLSRQGTTQVGNMVAEVIDSTTDYVALLKRTFDFPAIAALLQRRDFIMTYDAMSGAAGPYARKVLVEELGADPAVLMRCTPKEDFGGCHPDPNLTYAPELIATMGLNADGSVVAQTQQGSLPDFGAAADGDGDRNMILGKQFFVTPSDSLAVIAANAQAIPHFKRGLKAAARSMPTSAALDRVGAVQGFKVFETPTGWKFFGNLMDSSSMGGEDYSPFLCGEESFGTGSDHIREKDGLWAVLAWLSILAQANSDPVAPLVSIKDIVTQHWQQYGRNYYCRYDYEGVASAGAEEMMQTLRGMASGSAYEQAKQLSQKAGFELAKIDDFEYTDPIDGSISRKQGVRILMADGSRAVFRLSGTGSEGATVRLYVEKFEPDVQKQQGRATQVLEPLLQLAVDLSKLQQFTGRSAPSVIT